MFSYVVVVERQGKPVKCYGPWETSNPAMDFATDLVTNNKKLYGADDSIGAWVLPLEAVKEYSSERV